MEKCGCTIDTKVRIRGENVIVFCPLHTVAGEMLKSLERLMRRHIYSECGCGVCNDARAIILKAKGE